MYSLIRRHLPTLVLVLVPVAAILVLGGLAFTTSALPADGAPLNQVLEYQAGPSSAAQPGEPVGVLLENWQNTGVSTTIWR